MNGPFRKYFIAILWSILGFSATLSAAPFSLKQALSVAEVGSFILLAQNKTLTFLRVSEKSEQRLILEEITLSEEHFRSLKMATRTWYLEGAPCHNSWRENHIDLVNGHIETYCCKKGAWLNNQGMNALFATLLTLEFDEIPQDKRRRIGAIPGHGQRDDRPLWHPRLIVDGVCYPKTPFTAFRAIWPNDGSELAHKHLDIYLPEQAGESYPLFFPYFLEIDSKMGALRIRAIDAGMALFPY